MTTEEVIKQLCDHLEAAAHILYDNYVDLWEAYVDAGLPYGRSHDGLVDWLQELSEEENSEKG